MGVIFDGADIVVLDELGHESDKLVISFSARNSSLKKLRTPAEQMTGPGQSFFESRSLPCLMFCARWNHWWQSDEMDQAIAIIKQLGILDRYAEIITYGMSMGGYGALMYSQKLGASRVLAVAPQYSIDSNKVKEETRWYEDRKTLRFKYDDMEIGLIKTGDVAVVYDPLFDLDRIHAEKVRSHRPITALRTPFGTHTVGRLLDDMGIFSSLIETFLKQGVDRSAFRTRVRNHRRLSPVYLTNQARALQKRRRIGDALNLGELAMDVLRSKADSSPRYLSTIDRAALVSGQVLFYIGLLTDNGRAEDALSLSMEWAPRLPQHSEKLLIAMASARFELGQLQEANQTLWRALAQKTPVGADLLNSAFRCIAKWGVAKDVESLDQNYRNDILKEANLSLRVGELLLRFDLRSQAAVYFESGAVRQNALTPVTARRRVLGLAAAAGVDKAAALANRLLKDNEFQKQRDALLAELIKPVKPADGERARDWMNALQKLEASGANLQDVEVYDEQYQDRVLGNELIAVRFATLLQKCGLPERAGFYYEHAAMAGGDLTERLANRRVIGLAKCGRLPAARALIEKLLTGPAYEKVRLELTQKLSSLGRIEADLLHNSAESSVLVVAPAAASLDKISEPIELAPKSKRGRKTKLKSAEAGDGFVLAEKKTARSKKLTTLNKAAKLKL